jgi:hypothetical protein
MCQHRATEDGGRVPATADALDAAFLSWLRGIVVGRPRGPVLVEAIANRAILPLAGLTILAARKALAASVGGVRRRWR